MSGWRPAGSESFAWFLRNQGALCQQRWFVGAEATAEMAGRHLDQFGAIDAAAIDDERTTRMERAAAWRIDRIGDLAARCGHRVARFGIGLWHGRQQRARVGMSRRGVESDGRRDLDDA